MENVSRISAPLTKLTQKNVKLHEFVDEGVKFQVKSNLFDKIKAAQNKDDSLLRIRNEVE